jgi:LuxR family maltose regulon positive regulatory protein
MLAGSSSRRRGGGMMPETEPLSDGELRVLGYLPSNLSAPEIGAELYISLNTVKTHMRHIYEKLEVHSRTAAVRRARELGVLAPSSSRWR